MIGLSHVILHLGMCARVEHLTPRTPVAIRVRLTDRVGTVRIDQEYQVDRAAGAPSVALDVAWGTYRLEVAAPQYDCSASEYVAFLAGRNRGVRVNLIAGTAAPAMPVLISGNLVRSHYGLPTFVLLDFAANACNKPIEGPLPWLRVDMASERDAYYAALYPQPPFQAGTSAMLALRLQRPDGTYVYVQLPLPLRWKTWPLSVRFDETTNLMRTLKYHASGILFCPYVRLTFDG